MTVVIAVTAVVTALLRVCLSCAAEVCKVWREPGWQHCYQCGVCIRKLHHHCPWTSKCVGETNTSYFFTFGTFAQSLSCYTIVVLILYFTLRHS